MTEDRGGTTEDRSGVTEDRGGVTEDRGEVTEDRGVVTEDRGAVTEDRVLFFYHHIFVHNGVPYKQCVPGALYSPLPPRHGTRLLQLISPHFE